jgi:DNA-binding NarL/FixJ family response regulator
VPPAAGEVDLSRGCVGATASIASPATYVQRAGADRRRVTRGAEMELPRLLILAEEHLFGRGLAKLLQPRFETHSVDSFERARRLAGNGRAEIVLWVGDCLDAATAARFEELRPTHPGLRLCIVVHAADPEALRALLARRREAVAVLQRRDGLELDALVAALDDVLSGRSTLEPRILAQLLTAAGDDDALADLTPDEQEILRLVAYGLRNGEIARRVWKSEKSVERQVSHVFLKLGLHRSRHPHIDRRVTAARIYFACRPGTAEESVPPPRGGTPPCRCPVR